MHQLGNRRRRLAVLGLAALVAAATTGPPAAGQSPPSLGLQDVAKATALTIAVAPSVGALELAVQVGTSVAEIRNRLAQSQSSSLDLGLIGSALVGEGCSGRPATIKEENLPKPVRTDNRGGDSAIESAEAAPAGTAFQVLRQIVQASGQPSALASTSTALGDLGLVQVRGGESSATVEVVDGGAARVARAVTEFDVTIPGVLALTGLRWEAVHRTGTDPMAEASFSIGALEVLGVAIPVADLPVADVLAAANTALAPLGFQLAVPVVERITEPADLIRVSPLVLRITRSDLRELLLAPLLDATRELRDGLSNALVEATCDAGVAVLVAEVLLGQVSGIGSTDIALGGAEALTGQVDAGEGLTDPIDDIADDVVDLPPAASGDLVTSTPTPPVARPATPVAPPVAAPVPLPVRPIGDFERICESVHPFKWPSCSEGVGPFVGIGGILAVLAFGLADWQHQRRRRAVDG